MTPTGALEAVPARGLFTGNRGVLHDEDFQVKPARWKHQNWIICGLAFKGRWRAVMTPRRWTELFFLDEAVALAAGHRPCAECRRQAYNAYMIALVDGLGRPHPGAQAVDRHLHGQRAVPGACHLRRHVASMEDLPDGAFVLHDDTPCLIHGDRLLPWSHTGYGPPRPRGEGQTTLLTPPATVAALKAGFQPVLHPSAKT